MVVGCTATFSFSWLGSVSQPIGCEKDPVQVPYLPLDSVFVSEMKKFPETFLVSIVKYFIVDRLYIVSMLFIYCEVFQGPMW